MTEIDKKLLLILRDIVSRTPALLNEIDVFDLESARILKDFTAGKSISTLMETRDEDFEFGGTAIGTLEVISFLQGTFLLVDQYRNEPDHTAGHPEATLLELQQNWKSNLTRSGLSQDLAAELVVTCAEELIKIIRLRSSAIAL